MSRYRHCPLSSPSNIRLLRLLPHDDQSADIQCELSEYSLEDSFERSHLYEALSYVWGDENEKLPIFISGCRFDVTINLHAALLRLRNHSMQRLLWIDAICIDQENLQEKEYQIRFMSEIYGHANRVVVWLGEQAEDSDLAFEEILVAGNKASQTSLGDTRIQQAVLALVERPWFRRIWILQEVAAARHILITCGFSEIDGHVFCLGVDALSGIYDARAHIQSLTRSVTYLIRGAIFRPKRRMSGLDRGQTISSLGELIDMYHTHEATKVHDKVYALLGMSSDDFSKAGLSPDYGVSWEEILQRLVKYLLGEALLVETSCKREVALIKCKGFVLGKVVSVQRNSDKQDVDVDLEKYIRQRAGYPKGTSSVRWTLAISAKPIQYEDVICYVQGAPGPTIIRPCKDHFSIIKIATFPLNEVKRVDWKTFKAVTCDLHLVWDWGNPRERLQDYGIYESSMRKTNSIWEHPKTEPEFRLGEAIRTGNIASILTKLGLINAAKWGENAIEGYDIAFGKSSTKTTYTYTGHSPLLWAAYNGYDEIVNLLITKYGVDPDTKDSRLGQTSLSWAVMAGQKSVVKLLLSMDKVDADSRNYSGFTPLLYAAITGEEAIVKLLLQTNKVNVNSSSQDGGTQLSLAGTPLSLAIENGHEGVVKLLLDTGNVDVESTNKSGETPLSLAAKTGDEAVVKLLLDTRKVDVGSRDEWGRTPLSVAAQNGHEAIVKLLLGIEEVDVNSEDIWGITPLSVAANRGYKSIIKLLLNTEKVEVESKDRMGRTPLSHAAEQGYESVIELLLDTGKVNVNIVDKWVAETKGHIAVVELFDKRLHE